MIVFELCCIWKKIYFNGDCNTFVRFFDVIIHRKMAIPWIRLYFFFCLKWHCYVHIQLRKIVFSSFWIFHISEKFFLFSVGSKNFHSVWPEKTNKVPFKVEMKLKLTSVYLSIWMYDRQNNKHQNNIETRNSIKVELIVMWKLM